MTYWNSLETNVIALLNLNPYAPDTHHKGICSSPTAYPMQHYLVILQSWTTPFTNPDTITVFNYMWTKYIAHWKKVGQEVTCNHKKNPEQLFATRAQKILYSEWVYVCMRIQSISWRCAHGCSLSLSNFISTVSLSNFISTVTQRIYT